MYIVSERLIIFTRYPEPGKTKTRLIPSLGPEGAATLQRQMTEHTLTQARTLRDSCRLAIEVWFAGGDRCHMQAWLGSDLCYQPQGQGDLGTRLQKAFLAAFESSMERTVTIGTDCPGLNAQLLAKAFQKLYQHDLVLGPAVDGGYYLIGLRRFIPELFVGITWGSAAVLGQTVDRAERLGLSIAYLTPLEDVDRPEDIPVWQQTLALKAELETSDTPSAKTDRF